jgi:hypothetical protein
MVTRCHLCNPEPASWLHCGCGSSAGAHRILQGTSKLPVKLPLLPEDGENVKCGRGGELGRGIDETEVRFVSHEGLAKHGPGLEPRLVHFQPGLDEAYPPIRSLHNTPGRIRDACWTPLLKLFCAVTWWCCLSTATNGVEAEEEEEEKLLDEERDDVPFVHGSLLREKDPVHVNALAGSGEEIATPASTASVVRPLRVIIGEVGDNEECDQQGHARLLRREDVDYVVTTGDGSADTFVLPPALTSADGDGEAGGVQVVASEAAGEDAGSEVAEENGGEDAGDNDEDDEDEDKDDNEEEDDAEEDEEDDDDDGGDGGDDGDGGGGGDGGDGDGDGNCEDLGSPGHHILVGKISPRDYQDTINDFPPL